MEWKQLKDVILLPVRDTLASALIKANIPALLNLCEAGIWSMRDRRKRGVKKGKDKTEVEPIAIDEDLLHMYHIHLIYYSDCSHSQSQGCKFVI